MVRLLDEYAATDLMAARSPFCKFEFLAARARSVGIAAIFCAAARRANRSFGSAKVRAVLDALVPYLRERTARLSET